MSLPAIGPVTRAAAGGTGVIATAALRAEYPSTFCRNIVRRNIAPSMPNATSICPTTELEKVTLLKILSSTIGFAWSFSKMIKAARNSTASTNKLMMALDVQPQSPPLMIASTSVKTLMEDVITPT
jgi:hypothetical protein